MPIDPRFHELQGVIQHYHTTPREHATLLKKDDEYLCAVPGILWTWFIERAVWFPSDDVAARVLRQFRDELAGVVLFHEDEDSAI